MYQQLYRFDPDNILVPALPDPINLTAPAKFGPNLTLLRGQALGLKTSDGNLYPFNKSASDGTQNWVGFNQMTGSTDANGIFYRTSGGSASATFYDAGTETGTMWTSGVFDPAKLYTSPQIGSDTAEVDTFTPASPTTGDLFSVTTAGGLSAEFTIGSTQTAAAAVTGLTSAWNSNPALKAIATASGSATFILTAATPGSPLNLTATTVGTGTLTKVITTAPSTGIQTEVDTFTASSPTTGDVYTLTINYPNLTTHAVSATVGATQTATAISALLIAAWNADPVAAAYATASGTATVVLTSTVPGNLMNVTGATVGTGTVSKAVTTPAYGRSIADIQTSRPGAYILQPYGFWRV